MSKLIYLKNQTFTLVICVYTRTTFIFLFCFDFRCFLFPSCSYRQAVAYTSKEKKKKLS